MAKIQFELLLRVIDLSNVPLLDGNHCYMVVTISNHKGKNYKKFHRTKVTTESVAIFDHKCTFKGEGYIKQLFRLNLDPKSEVLSNKWLCVSFILIDKTDKHEGRLGTVNINLAEYANETKPASIRYLLDQSKTNSIAKLSIFLRHLTDDSGIKYKVPESSSGNFYQGITQTLGEDVHRSSSELKRNKTIPLPTAKETVNDKNGSSTCFIKSTADMVKELRKPSELADGRSSKLPSAGSVASPLDENADSLGLDPRVVKEICDSIFTENNVLNGLINRTYRFTWQTKDKTYEEFTPMECVQDIVEYNGNGWKKNDEGLNMIDVVKNEIKENWRRKKKRTDRISYEYNGNRSEESSSDSENSERYGSESESEDDSRKRNKAKRYVPPTEIQMREDLKSWHVGEADGAN
ncbi:DEKNAAC102320 [Brettanomyces naardenensis]|uniref:DEKNAAC102320 n=1 Tax=Brettanomyces naardenensis TaxID=13370 RepID=A0A448YLH6_BRENA|nr:DEKNAAC102320 [Brettanomyces naardenensis]